MRDFCSFTKMTTSFHTKLPNLEEELPWYPQGPTAEGPYGAAGGNAALVPPRLEHTYAPKKR